MFCILHNQAKEDVEATEETTTTTTTTKSSKKDVEHVYYGPRVKEGEYVFGVAHIYASFNDTFVVSAIFAMLMLWLNPLIISRF